MKRSPIRRKTRLKRGTKRLKRTPLPRSSRLSPVGRRRKKQRKSGEVFGKHADAVRRIPCVVCGRPGPNDVHHVRSRGAGFKDRLPDGSGNCVSLCDVHHVGDEGVHTLGPETFASRFAVDLAAIARRIGVDICQ